MISNIIDFDPSKSLIQLSSHPLDSWKVDDAMKGISIIGGTGSGKTSASGRAFALKFLKEGWGGLILCAKTDEAALWLDYCKKTGRYGDVIMFGNGSRHEDPKHKFYGREIVFNPIDYEMKRAGDGAGETQNITNIFMNIYKMGNRISGGSEGKEERFWDTALKRCLNRVIELLKLADEDLTYLNMVKVMGSTFTITETLLGKEINRIKEGEPGYNDLKESCYGGWCILKAYHYQFFLSEEDIPERKKNTFNLVTNYFTKDFPNLGEKTQGTILESFMGLAEPFFSGILERHFSGATTLFPECIFQERKIIILDFPIKEYLDAGIIGQSVYKIMFQQAVERRDCGKFPMPVFLWCDEAQYFINEYDQIFLTTARASRTSTVFLSQNISNYYAIMGNGQSSQAKVDSLMGNLSTKIFHANSDAVTNEYASRLIGMESQHVVSAGFTRPHLSLEKTESENINVSYLPQVYPKDFTVLKSGGELNNFKVQAVIMTSGREWANGKNYIKVTFTQNFDTNT